MTLPLLTWCGLFLKLRLVLCVELVSPGLCHPDRAAHLCPQKIRVFLSLNTLLELLHSRELIQPVLIIISPASRVCCAWISRCLGLWASPGQPIYCWTPFSPKEAKQGIQSHRDNKATSYCSWNQRIWARSSTPGEFFSCCDVWTSLLPPSHLRFCA